MTETAEAWTVGKGKLGEWCIRVLGFRLAFRSLDPVFRLLLVAVSGLFFFVVTYFDTTQWSCLPHPKSLDK